MEEKGPARGSRGAGLSSATDKGGRPQWRVQSTFFCGCGIFDPRTDANRS